MYMNADGIRQKHWHSCYGSRMHCNLLFAEPGTRPMIRNPTSSDVALHDLSSGCLPRHSGRTLGYNCTLNCLSQGTVHILSAISTLPGCSQWSPFAINVLLHATCSCQYGNERMPHALLYSEQSRVAAPAVRKPSPEVPTPKTHSLNTTLNRSTQQQPAAHALARSHALPEQPCGCAAHGPGGHKRQPPVTTCP